MCRLNPALSCMHSSCYPLSDNEDPSPAYTPLACLKCVPSRHINRLLQSTPHGQRAHKCAKWTVSHTAKGLTPHDSKEGKGEGKDIGQTDRRTAHPVGQCERAFCMALFIWIWIACGCVKCPSIAYSSFVSLPLPLSRAVSVCACLHWTRRVHVYHIYKLHYIHALLQAASAAMKKLQSHYAN